MKKLKKFKQWWNLDNTLFFVLTECTITNGAIFLLIPAILSMMAAGTFFILSMKKWMFLTLLIAVLLAVKFFKEMFENTVDE